MPPVTGFAGETISAGVVLAGVLKVKWFRGTNPLKRVDFGFDISEDSPIRRPMRCRGAHQLEGAATNREPPIGLEYRVSRPCLASRLDLPCLAFSDWIYRASAPSSVESLSCPGNVCYRPLLAGSSLRFSRAPWLLSFLEVRGFEPVTLLREMYLLTTSLAPSGRAKLPPRDRWVCM